MARVLFALMAGARMIVAALGALILLGASRASAATPAEIAALQALPCPAYDVLGGGSSTPAQRAAAAAGTFEVMRGLPATLVPPVNWHQDPYGNRSWVFYLHSFAWIAPLLDAYALNNDANALAQSRDLIEDWVAQVPPGDASYGKLAWEVKSVGDRGGRLSYAVRALACEGLLSDAQAGALIDSLREHARELANPANYRRNNHGLFGDYGLTAIAARHPYLGEAPSWLALAEERYRAVLGEELSANGRFFLEHSPYYQLLVIDLTERLGRLGPDFASEIAGMKAGAGWFVTPRATLAPLGDSKRSVVAPGSWLARSGGAASGFLADTAAGIGVVKREGAYLAMTAWFHGAAHHHDDALSFHLHDRGRDVISDSGHYSYQRDAWDRFQRSAAAHSGLTVAGNRLRGGKHAYGSGLRASGRGGGWFALEGVDPSLRTSRNARHSRLLLYRPGYGVVVVDRVRSARPKRYVRRFQVAAGIDARRRGTGYTLRARGFRGFVDFGARAGRLEALRGSTSPIAGWEFPGFLKRTPRFALSATQRATDAEMIATVGLRGRLRAELHGTRPSSTRLTLRSRGDRLTLRVVRRGKRLVVTAR